MIRLAIYIALLLAITACGNNKEQALALERKAVHKDSTGKSTEKAMTKPEVFDCMLNTIYYKLKINGSEIDTIKTHYFHEIVDYEDSNLRKGGERLQRVREIMKDSAFIPGFQAKKYEKELDSLILYLNGHDKSTVGYVLVHTFFYKPDKDTQTMIFVLDKHCGHKDAIRVKSIKNINPEDYLNSFRNF